MTTGCRIFFLLLWLILTFVSALLLFTKGFLLKRIVVDKNGECEPTHWLIGNLRNGLRTNMRLQPESTGSSDGCNSMTIPKFSKVVFVIIDGLRYDFLQHQKDVNSSMALPFQNKMKKVHELLSAHPTNAKLFKFEADPPTTTMQRIKGITTGSLPTFVDAGTNFDSSEITEDNILDHVVRRGKNISFMGCSTWTELYPNRFHRKIPFSALNVKDLDTIDYGIIKNIFTEIKRDDWSLLIAHFLGVDHCGHRYGTHHYEMTRKLTEMDRVISDLVTSIDEDTILLVMGDHGMTMSGDHGGDSKDEVMAGLFAYSKKNIFSIHSEVGDELPKVSQIDLVPTLSLMLDIPIPFSNLGSIIPHFFDGDTEGYLPDFLRRELNYTETWNTVDEASHIRLKEASLNLFKNINLAYVSYINCKQILRYLDEYQKVATDLPGDQIEAVRASFSHLEEQYEQNLDELVLIDWINKSMALAELSNIEENLQELYYLHLSFQNVLSNFKTICRTIWAKFDIMSMSLGLSLMLFIALACCLTPLIIIPTSITDPERLMFVVYIAGFSFCLTGVSYLAIPFEDTDTSSFIVFAAASFSFSLWLLSCGSSTLLYIHQHISINKFKLLFAKQYFYITCLVFYLGSLFANSYIIHEDTNMLFFCQSFVFFNFLYSLVSMLREHKLIEAGKPNKSRNFSFLRSKLLQRLTSKPMLKTYMCTAVMMVSMRLTRYFWFCREMQLKCNISPYSLQLASLLSEFAEASAHERLFIAFVSIIVMTLLTYFYLKQRGNMKGTTSSVFAVKLVGALSVMILLLHWSLQLKLTNEISNKLFDLPYFQQIILPRALYILFIISVLYLVLKPLSVFVVRRGKQDKVRDYIEKGNVLGLYNILWQNNSNEASSEESNRPFVYGLQCVYSTSFVSLLFVTTSVAAMVLTDGLAFPVNMLWIAAFCLSRFFSLDKRSNICNNSELVEPIIMWNFFASMGFFATGHQNAISAIRFHAAYIGFKGSVEEIIPQVIVILFNTFAAQMVCALALPLLLIFKRLSSSPTAEEDENEYLLAEYPDVSRINLFKMLVAYLGVLMLKVSVAAASASLHRRHLMVWKIFGPRFMFEAVAFLVTTPVLLLGFCYFLRIDNKLCEWKSQLQKETR